MKTGITALLLSFCCTAASAQQKTDTTKIIDIEKIAVYSFKTIEPIRETPASVSVFGPAAVERNGIDSPNKLTALSPNFFMPEYGSRLTSAVYIRGVGSRMNDPAVGLYVDNIPYLDKSTYDFDLYDLSRIEVLRGPQGTLYGRNAMGGIIGIFTPSPLYRRGTKAVLSYGNGNTYHAGAVHYARLGEGMGLSAGINYRHTDGFFKNTYDGRNADESTSGSFRLRYDWQIGERWLLNATVSGERSEQKGYPYGLVDAQGNVAAPDYNDPMGYDRDMTVGSLYWQYSGRGFSVAGTTSYQYFDDRMQLDQDFTPVPLFTLEQSQTQHAFTQEVIAKSTSQHRYQWLAGVFGFDRRLFTGAPVGLKQAFFNDLFAGMPPAAPKMSVTGDCDTDGTYDTPSYGLAAFHQSSLRMGPVTASLGLRVDYEKTSIEHNTGASLPLRCVVSPYAPPIDYTQGLTISGDDDRSFWQFCPKLAIDYAFGQDNRVYLSASRGYRSGGYNIQLFSDLVSSRLRADAKSNRTMTSQQVEATIDEGAIYYKPEYSWNYELGSRLVFLDGRLQADAAVFYIDSRNQQVTQFVPSGLGRVMKNAGHSRSCGAELSLGGRVGNYTAHAAYGFTSAKFIRYTDSLQVSGQAVAVEYGGRFVPFVPRHTLSVGLERTFNLRNAWIDRIVAGVRYQGIGKIYFTENNDTEQDFYSLLSGEAAIEKDRFSLCVWAKNITDASYKLFFFHGMNGNSFAQQGNPFQVGVTLKMSL